MGDELQSQSPFSPLYLPEFNTHVSWFMCQNPACENFGHHFRPDNSQPVNQRTISDSRYRIDTEKQRFHCGSCQMSCALKSNSSIRTVARYFLSHSFPFADCPDAECANHGRNLFEHRPRSTTGRRRGSNRLPYFLAGKHRVECSACGGKFTVGAPLRLRDRDPEKIAKVLDGIFDQRRVSRTLRVKGMSSSSYYSRLRQHAVALRDWQSVQTAQLLRKEYAEWQAPLRIYTDTVQVSMQRAGDGARHQILNIIVTVMASNRRYFVLAAHPAFLPVKHPTLDVLIRDDSVPRHLREWDALDHGFGSTPREGTRNLLVRLPNLGCGGYFLNSPYVELAHFLVVAKLLSRFPKVHLYTDSSKPLYSAALTTFRGEIQSGRVEIALFQHDKERQQGRKKQVVRDVSWKPKTTPNAGWKRFEKALAKKTNERALKFGVNPDAGVMAQVFKSAFKGANSERSAWAWLAYPRSNKQYSNPRTLWLTWHPSKDFESVGKPVFEHATLQPVDSAFSALRSRATGMHRAGGGAIHGRSYKKAYADPMNVMAELWIALFGFNHLTLGKEEKIPRSTLYNLAPEDGTQPKAEHVALQFCLNTAHAEKITRWASR